jgi:two-component system, OmpR family, sensor kinase
MIDRSSNSKGIALLCDAQGIIHKIVHNDFALDANDLLGVSFTRLAIPASVAKSLNFLTNLKEHEAVFNWEINVQLGNEVSSLHFAGAVVNEDLLIVGAKNNGTLHRLYEELMRIHNEQAILFRETSKTNIESSMAEKRNQTVYDQLSQLNNELANLQRELTQKNMALERLNEQKNRFLGMAAHDLRNPLAIILGYSEFLIEDVKPPLSQDKAEMVSIIRNSSQFMLGLVNDLLDIATIESGKLLLNQEPTDLNRLLGQAAILNQVLATPKDIQIHYSTLDTLPPLLLDQQKLIQVLNNLLSNAVKFSPPQTTVHLSVKRDSDEVVVMVKDEGQGIPPSEMDKLFKPFSVTSVRSTAGEKSTGLGLAISRRIIEGHGGHIWVQSEVGHDTTFGFSLPLSLQLQDEMHGVVPPTKETPTEENQSLHEPKSASLRILLAEDNKLNQKVAELTLKKIGLEIDIANDGTEVLEMLRTTAYDIILMDVNMPIMDGLEATRKIRAEWPPDEQPRIIAMTGGTSTEEREDCLNAGMDEFLTKPFQLHLLKSLLGIA